MTLKYKYSTSHLAGEYRPKDIPTFRAVVPKLFRYAEHLKFFSAPKAPNINFYGDSFTTGANLVDHQGSVEQTLGINVLEI